MKPRSHEMPRIGKGQHRNRRNRPTHSVRFRILSFLFEYKNQVKQGQPWPVAFFIRTNLFSQRQNWTAETRGARTESDVSTPSGSSPRPDLFQGELDACCESGWVERITDKASKRIRYRITSEGEAEYQKWVVHFLSYLDFQSNLGVRDSGKAS